LIFENISGRNISSYLKTAEGYQQQKLYVPLKYTNRRRFSEQKTSVEKINLFYNIEESVLAST
jgi:hypothetical protein